MSSHSFDFTELTPQIKAWAKELGFGQAGITNCHTDDADKKLRQDGSFIERKKKRHPIFKTEIFIYRKS